MSTPRPLRYVVPLLVLAAGLVVVGAVAGVTGNLGGRRGPPPPSPPSPPTPKPAAGGAPSPAVVALVAVMTDATAPLSSRAQATFGLASAIKNDADRELTRHAIEQVLTGARPDDPDHDVQFLTGRAFMVMSTCGPWRDVTELVRPFLAARVPDVIRTFALEAISDGPPARGLAEDLAAIVDEPFENPLEKRASSPRAKIERATVRATRGLQSREAIHVLGIFARKSAFHFVRLEAVHQLASMPSRWDGFQGDSEGRLREILGPMTAESDFVLAWEAAVGLVRLGSWEGIAPLVSDLLARPTRTPDAAFERVRGVALCERPMTPAEIASWWSAAKATTPEALLVEALRARGIDLPPAESARYGPTSPPVVALWIEALDLEPRELRARVLDAIVRRTGRADFAREFSILDDGIGSIRIRQDEPVDGFPAGSEKAEKLRQQQKDRAARLKAELAGSPR